MPSEKDSIPEFDQINLIELLVRPEDETFDRTRGGQDSIGRKIAAFATKNGGLLLIGQEDLQRGGQILGIDLDQFHQEFTNAMASVKPKPLTQQKIMETNGLKLALIRIQDAGTLRPCAYGGTFYERKGSSNPELQPEEVKRYHLMYGATNSEEVPTHAKRADADDAELENYSGLLKKTKENILQSVSSTKGYLTVRGVAVLAKKPDEFLEGAFVEVQKYDNLLGTNPVPMGPPIRLSKPARLLIEDATRLIEQNLPVERSYEGAKMTQTPAIPSSVIRETITNAVAHRNYRSHEHIRVRIFSDGFDVSNPAAINEKMWNEIQDAHTTYHPNEGIYTFLNPAQLYEGRGEGIWKIKEELEKRGLIEPQFKVIGDAPATFYARISLTPAKSKDVKRQKLEQLIAKKKEITTTEVMRHLNVSRVTAIRLLNKLVDQGKLEHQGNTKTSKYVALNPKEENKPNA